MNRLTYSVADAVEALSVGKTTLYKLIAEGRIKTIKIGSRTLIPADIVHSLAQNGI